jgi:hypothetical protein
MPIFLFLFISPFKYSTNTKDVVRSFGLLVLYTLIFDSRIAVVITSNALPAQSLKRMDYIYLFCYLQSIDVFCSGDGFRGCVIPCLCFVYFLSALRQAKP